MCHLLREDIQTRKLFNSGIARITQTRRFARMAEKNTDDDNNCCHDNFGNFDDNDVKKY